MEFPSREDLELLMNSSDLDESQFDLEELLVFDLKEFGDIVMADAMIPPGHHGSSLQTHECNSEFVLRIDESKFETEEMMEMLLEAPMITPCNDATTSSFHNHADTENINQRHLSESPDNFYSPPLVNVSTYSDRLIHYLYHLRNRPKDNSIAYWQTFVAEYFAPGSKKKWCFSSYEDIDLFRTGPFWPESVALLSCEICASTSGKAMEATFEMFHRLFKCTFESGMVDQILCLGLPVACKLPSGLTVLYYEIVIEESVYENFRVVHEGKLRIVFQVDLKILSSEFCAQKHEVFLLQGSINSQVNQFLQAARIYCNSIQKNGGPMCSSEDLQRNLNMMVSTCNNIKNDAALPLLNELGYPKSLFRFLMMTGIYINMKDLMAFSSGMNLGPIESLNVYAQLCNIGDQTQMKGATEYHNVDTNNDPSPYTSPRSQSSEHSKNDHDKLLRDMPEASGKLTKEITMRRSLSNWLCKVVEWTLSS